MDAVSVPLEGYLRLMSQLKECRNRTAIYLIFEDSSVTSLLYRDGVYYQLWNPLLFRHSTGKLFLFYKYGRPFEHWDCAYLTSDDGDRPEYLRYPAVLRHHECRYAHYGCLLYRLRAG